MDLETVNKLLNTRRLDDILIGIALSYELPFEEFDSLYHEYRDTNIGGKALYYRFERNGIKYGFGNASFTRYVEYEDTANPEDIIDITPEKFKNEKNT